ncbi:hypothetical protein [Salinisphaera sp. T31B1]|uniref:Acb2/Tad1 domain-containing protein n=1 Tax=Salinisphaera sp. T31B1 TaxID=727963 RepID=UPI00333F0723
MSRQTYRIEPDLYVGPSWRLQQWRDRGTALVIVADRVPGLPDCNVAVKPAGKNRIPGEAIPRGFLQLISDQGNTMADHVDSTSNDRTTNNAVRHKYRVLTDEEKAQMQKIKDDGLAMLEYFDSIGQSRELSLAKTKIEEAVMWSCKHVTS